MRNALHPVYQISSGRLPLTCLIGLMLLLFTGGGKHAFAEENQNLAGYIATALEQNPEIRAAQARVDEAAQRIRQAGVLPDPKLGAEYFLQPIETRTGPQEASLSLSQSFPWPGKLSLEKKLKRHDADITETMLDGTRLSVIRKLKEAYIEYGYLGQAKEITGQILELMNYMEGIVRTNYSSGKASFADVLKLQIEIDKLKNRQQSLEDNGFPVRAQINALLGAENDIARPQPSSLPRISLLQKDDEILTLTRQHNPKMMASQEKVSRSRTDLDMADLGFYPEFTLSVKTIFTGEAEFGMPPDSGQDPVVAGLAISLPIFIDKRNGAIAEKQASIQAARDELKQTVNNLDAETELILFRYREASRLLDLYRDNLIPTVRRELDVTLESFQGGQSTIMELLDTEKNWLSFELAGLRAQADMGIQIARLEEVTGTTLADWNQ